MIDPFLNYITHRRLTIQKELEELEIVERIYKEGQKESLLYPKTEIPHTIKQMVLTLLTPIAPLGLTTKELLAQIQSRWKPNLTSESLSSMLSRIKVEGWISRDDVYWKIMDLNK